MKQKIRLFVAAALMTVLFSITAFAAGWNSGKGEDSGRWWYDLGNGNWYGGCMPEPGRRTVMMSMKTEPGQKTEQCRSGRKAYLHQSRRQTKMF